jgi:MarR family 2-MHQ and catechol resistance regulon transcriptional repressor
MTTNERYGLRAARALDLWVKLARAFSTLNHQAEVHIRSFGLTQPQFSVLECLGHRGSMTLGELCRKHLVSGGNMTVVVDNLERDGLVERIRSKDDRRQVSVELTPAGQKLFEKIFPPHADFITDCANVLAKDEQEQLSTLLKKLGLGIVKQRCNDHNKEKKD